MTLLNEVYDLNRNHLALRAAETGEER